MSCDNRPGSACDPFPPYARAKNCARCGAAFLCGPTEDNGDCWCDRLPNVMPLLSPEDGCLCKACLQMAITDRLTENIEPPSL